MSYHPFRVGSLSIQITGDHYWQMNRNSFFNKSKSINKHSNVESGQFVALLTYISCYRA